MVKTNNLMMYIKLSLLMLLAFLTGTQKAKAHQQMALTAAASEIGYINNVIPVSLVPILKPIKNNGHQLFFEPYKPKIFFPVRQENHNRKYLKPAAILSNPFGEKRLIKKISKQ